MKIKKVLSALIAGCMLAVSTITVGTSNAEYSRASVHDPSIVKLEDGSYYIIGSHLGAARSNDLQNWTPIAAPYQH